MFHTLITLAYLIPGLYLFIRIWSLFIKKSQRIQYLLIFGFFYALYPVSNLLEGSETGFLPGLLEKVSSYLLPFYLYLFLFTLGLDILLLLSLIYRLVLREKTWRLKPDHRWLIVILTLSAAVLTYGIINFNTIRVTRYTISIPSEGSTAASLKIAFVSDLHLSDEVPVRFVEKFVDKTNASDPDFVLFGGDIVEGRSLSEKASEFEEMLSNLRPVYGCYGVLGNHDGYGRSNNSDFYKRAAIRILRDTAVTIPGLVTIAGRHDRRVSDRNTAEELIAPVSDELPVLLLDHRPDDFDAIARTKADIVMSGHTHHGQLFPINLITNSVYELSYGYLKKSSTHFFVSSGLRLWGPPVRTVARSEIMLVEVILEQNKH